MQEAQTTYTPPTRNKGVKVTPKQRKLAQLIAEDAKNGKTASIIDVATRAGYEYNTAQSKGTMLLEADGTVQALADVGISRQVIDSTVTNIMHTSQKDENRLRAADMLYKRIGAYASTEPKETTNNHLHLKLTQTGQTGELVAEFNERLRHMLRG